MLQPAIAHTEVVKLLIGVLDVRIDDNGNQVIKIDGKNIVAEELEISYKKGHVPQVLLLLDTSSLRYPMKQAKSKGRGRDCNPKARNKKSLAEMALMGNGSNGTGKK